MKKGQFFNLRKLVVLFHYTVFLFNKKLEIRYYIILVKFHNILIYMLTFLKFINHTR